MDQSEYSISGRIWLLDLNTNQIRESLNQSDHIKWGPIRSLGGGPIKPQDHGTNVITGSIDQSYPKDCGPIMSQVQWTNKITGSVDQSYHFVSGQIRPQNQWINQQMDQFKIQIIWSAYNNNYDHNIAITLIRYNQLLLSAYISNYDRHILITTVCMKQ